MTELLLRAGVAAQSFTSPPTSTWTPTTQSPVDQWLDDNPMLVGSIAMVVAIGVGIAMMYAAHHRNRRARSMAPTAAAHGLQYSTGDMLGCTQVAFPLFVAGEGRTVENLMWRQGANGLDLRVLDYAYYDEYKDKNGHVHKRWSYFTCAMARHNGLWPTVRVTRERVADKLGQKLGLPDIELESEEFNRMFIVQCEDRAFATALLDAQMMELLISTKGRITFETKGRWLLVIAPRVDTAAEMVGLLGVADEFIERIPSVVWELYPEGADTQRGVFDPDSGHDPIIMKPLDSVAQAMREEARESGVDWRDSTPGIEHDLDGNVIEPPEEDPWG